jgi:hypothetical protein
MCKRLGKRALRAAILRDCAAVEGARPVLHNTTKHARWAAWWIKTTRADLAGWAAWCRETRQEVCDVDML